MRLAHGRIADAWRHIHDSFSLRPLSRKPGAPLREGEAKITPTLLS